MTSIEKAIGSWLTACLPAGYTGRVIRADDRNVELLPPYATFKIIADRSAPAHPLTYIRAADNVRVVENVRNALVSVNVFGDDSYADLSDVALNIVDPVIVENARQDGLTVYVPSTDVRTPPDLGLATRGPRAQVDFNIQYVRTIETTVAPVIETIVGTDTNTGDTHTSEL